MLNLHADISGLRGAEYNPRRIDPESIATLAESIKTLGLVKPLIVRGDLLVAGHQRTRALRHLGITEAAVYELPKSTTTYDEVRFNPLHNGTDFDGGDEDCRISGDLGAVGFKTVEPARISGNMESRLAVVRAEIADLIVSYGPWGGCVVTQSGEVIHCAQYALAAKLTRTPLTIYVVKDADKSRYKAFLDKKYGVFSYEHLKRQTYIQSLAQMFRLRPNEKGSGLKSTLYETHVLAWLHANPTARSIDFGSGQGDYAKMLRAKGFDIDDVELFRRSKTSRALDMASIDRMISNMAATIMAGERYQATICDSVLNSVDCPQAEGAVMTMLNALTEMGGQVFFSGRAREQVEQALQGKAKRNYVRYVEFLDEEGFSALYREGRWFYQKFHTAEQRAALCARYGLKIISDKRAISASWQMHAVKVAELPVQQVKEAIEYEFDLPVSDTRTLGWQNKVWEAFKGYYEPSSH
jgi:ParB family chromosome partitioning protein